MALKSYLFPMWQSIIKAWGIMRVDPGGIPGERGGIERDYTVITKFYSIISILKIMIPSNILKNLFSQASIFIKYYKNALFYYRNYSTIH